MDEVIGEIEPYSRDGKEIAFEGDSPDGADTFTMNADGSEITNITSNLVELEKCGGNCVIADWCAEPVE